MYASYKAVEWNETGLSVGTGWLPPLPDLRDFTDAEPRIVEIVKKLGLPRGREARSVPSSVDLRSWCSPVEDQKSLGSCSAHAAVGIVEYFQRRAFGRHIEGSRLFVY